MFRSRTTAVIAVIFVLSAAVAWQFADGLRTSLQLAFADEQTEIFSDMAGKAYEAIHQDPPNVKAAVGCLDYVHSYYPSGTKQPSGSRLDRIVERSRSIAELRIIEMLRVATDADVGMTPEAWIRDFGGQAVSGE